MSDKQTIFKTCPTCGTRLNENATRCMVCGRNFSQTSDSTDQKIKGTRLPSVTLSLPIALLLILVFVVIGAAVVFLMLQSNNQIVEPTVTPTVTQTPTVTFTPTASLTPTLAPTWTPLPPISYTVKSGDLCSGIAAVFNISINTIILENNLSTDCFIYPGLVLSLPQPTATPSPLPTSTLSELESTDDACDKLDYTVQEGDTLSSISYNYNISVTVIKEYNGLTSDIVYEGMPLVLPLCQRNPTEGPSPTATLPPPYPAANLLQPPDGQVFIAANETITLQWAAVGTLRENEAYAVTVEDITDETGRKITEYVTDTKFIIPSSFRPVDDSPHILRWSIMPVRQTGSTSDGQAVWESAGERSAGRVFSWWGSQIITPTP
ncbi:MAG: LysM peptidoglycan-binding domain-containing protein [Chloroflexi bacterium]|nr:LysM peptidoglycan-binding domain-containing protein [Chloroflexota bacterium]